jgi:hypothetical protein
MTVTPRDRRFLAWGAVSVILSGVMYLWPSGASEPAAVSSTGSVETAEKRLARMRDMAATVPQKEAALKAVQAELATREAGVIQAPTAAQAKAQLLQILERLCAAETPPIRIVSNQLGGINALGSDYGAIDLSVELQCSIEQLVNLLAALAAQKELISTTDLRVTGANNPKEKIMGVHLGVSGVVPRKLLPEKAAEKTPEKKGAGI